MHSHGKETSEEQGNADRCDVYSLLAEPAVR